MANTQQNKNRQTATSRTNAWNSILPQGYGNLSSAAMAMGMLNTNPQAAIGYALGKFIRGRIDALHEAQDEKNARQTVNSTVPSGDGQNAPIGAGEGMPPSEEFVRMFPEASSLSEPLLKGLPEIGEPFADVNQQKLRRN